MRLAAFSSFIAKAFVWLNVGAAGFIALYWLVKIGTYSPCFTEAFGKPMVFRVLILRSAKRTVGILPRSASMSPSPAE